MGEAPDNDPSNQPDQPQEHPEIPHTPEEEDEKQLDDAFEKIYSQGDGPLKNLGEVLTEIAKTQDLEKKLAQEYETSPPDGEPDSVAQPIFVLRNETLQKLNDILYGDPNMTITGQLLDSEFTDRLLISPGENNLSPEIVSRIARLYVGYVEKKQRLTNNG